MATSLVRKLLLAALALVVVTLVSLDYVVTSYTAQQGGAVDNAVRLRVFSIAMGASLLALICAGIVSHSLATRVSRLKHLAAGMLGPDSSRRALLEQQDDLGSLERSLTGVAGELHTLVENLRFESARREAILGGMTEGVLAVDHELRIIFCNRAFLRAVGFRGEKYERLSLLEMVRHPELHDVVLATLVVGKPAMLRFQLSADTPRTFEVQTTPLAMPTGRGAIALFHDITDLERLEQVRKDFVANVSHELRTPLAGIIGYADTLLEGALEDTSNRRRFVEIIRTNAIRLGNIASDLLVLSELENGVETGEAELVSVRAVLDGALLTVENEAKNREVRLARGQVDDVYVSGSRLRLEQALLNLLANAIKFNGPGGAVTVSAALGPGHRVAITVADTGAGIPSEDLPRIFERFYRVDKARSRQVGGTGLGLSIVKHVVERMNGTVTVESQLGRGTAFVITVPAAASPLAKVM